VAAILTSPLLARCRAAEAANRRVELVARLLRHAEKASPHAGSIERRGSLGAAEFLAHHVAASRPVVITDWMRDWPALTRWTPALLASRLGDTEIEVMVGDTTSPALRTRGPDQRRRLLLRAFLDHITDPAAPRDLYLEAYNHALALPALAPLLGEISFSDEIFDPARQSSGISLWLGPAGTFTPLHHDTTDILFCQVYGQKRLWLVSPLETSLLRDLRGMWAGATLAELRERPEHAGMVVFEVTLSAGEALYLPAGWWHEVTALAPSLHLSVMHFRHASDLSFYRPGG
jgi:ribosomal protein L16 Arg81 hydroxylase